MKLLNEIAQWLIMLLLAITAFLPITIGVWESGSHQLGDLREEVRSVQTQLDRDFDKLDGASDVIGVDRSLQKMKDSLTDLRSEVSVLRYFAFAAFLLSFISLFLCMYMLRRIKKVPKLSKVQPASNINRKAA